MPENSGSAYARDVHLTDYIASQMDEKKSHD